MRADFERPSPFGDWLRRKVVRADTERGEVEVSYQPPAEARNRLGTLAGGALAAMLDSLTALAALSALPEGTGAVHTALSVDYLRPGGGGRIRGLGRAIARDGDTVRAEGELRDASDRVIARGRAELRVLEIREGGSA
jgi:uncharacterized protein (TIGR00369 family)